MTHSADERVILAALLWDRPTLVRTDRADAQAFLDALGPTTAHEPKEAPHTPVGLAAEGIRLERAGSSSEALALYQQLASKEGLPSLLGRCLMMWSAEVADNTVFEQIEPFIEAVAGENRELHARFLLKLATYALDKQLETQFARWLKAASQLAPSGSHLKRAISVVCSNLLDQHPTQDFWRVPAEVDPIGYEWIDELALGSARAELANLLKSRSRSPWTSSLHFGSTNLDTLMAADRQATWAGALWMRDSIRAQLAAQILTSSDHDGDQAFYGVAMWLLSGSPNIASVIDLAERKFSGDAADRLISLLEGWMSIGRVRRYVMPDAVAALCDLLSPPVIDRLLEKLPPPVAENASSDDIRLFWGTAALVAPESWRRRFSALSDAQKVSLLRSLRIKTLLALPPEERRRLSVVITASPPESEVEQAIGALLSLWDETGKDRVRGRSPNFIVEIAGRDSSLLTAHDLLEAEIGLRRALQDTVSAARKGHMSFGGRTIPQSLAILAWSRRTLESETIEMLMALASDGSLPGELRLDALVSLSSCAQLNLLSREQLDSLTIEPQRDPSWFESIGDELLRAAQLMVRAAVLTEDEEIAVLTLSRNSDARVREMICRATGKFLSSRTSVTIESALLAALYDPEEAVLVAALNATAEARFTKVSDEVINTRLGELYGRSGRRVRAAVTRAAKARFSRGHSAKLGEVIAVAGRDRSWVVRQAAELEGNQH
jgi:hypothetical protein